MIPKFRAWDKIDKKMIDVGKIILNGEKYSKLAEIMGCNPFYEDIWISPKGKDNVLPIDEIELMQSTGLTDMNGTMIYEGDIVKMQWTIYDEPELFYIRTIEGRAPRVDNRIKGKELWLVHQDCKVVGNIYQNCELLEVEE